MTQLIFLLGLLLAQPSMAHDSKHPEFDSWYKGLKNPNLKSAVVQDLGCCSKRDCHITEADIRSGQWWARLGTPHIQYGEPKTAAEAEHALDLVHYEVTWELTEWKKVPSEAILKVPNPTGSRSFATRLRARAKSGASYQTTSSDRSSFSLRLHVGEIPGRGPLPRSVDFSFAWALQER